jgi:RNase P/RNase MRP subunit p29
MRRSREEDPASRAARSELIGCVGRVVASGHPPLVGVSGTIVDETARTFLVETADGRELRVPKSGQRFGFATPDGYVEIDGIALAKPPEERVKLKLNNRR